MQEKTAVETAIKEAEEKCADGTAGECAAAWDNVSKTDVSYVWLVRQCRL